MSVAPVVYESLLLALMEAFMTLSPRRRTLLFATVTLTTVLVCALGASAIIAYFTTPPAPVPGTLRIYRPANSWLPRSLRAVGDTSTGRQSPLPASVPCGPPPITLPYTAQPPGGVASHPDGLAFARYSHPPGSVAAHYFSPPPAAEQIDVAFVADLRYDVAGGTIHVLTCAPSPALAQQELMLGSPEVELSPGRFGYFVNVGPNSPMPYRVRFAEGPLIVEVMSDNAMTDVVTFARDIAIGK